MSDFRDKNEQLKTSDADRNVSRADRREAGVDAGSTTPDATHDNNTNDNNMGVLGDVAHPFDQTNGILDTYDETHPGNVTGESPSEFAASARPAGQDAPRRDPDESFVDDDTPPVPPPMPSAGR